MALISNNTIKKMVTGLKINDLSDVTAAAPADNDSLIWNDATLRWESTASIHGFEFQESLVSYVPDMEKKDYFEYRLDQNATIGAPLNAKPGDTGTFAIRQDVVGGYTLTWAAEYMFSGGIPPVLSVAPNSYDLFEYYTHDFDAVMIRQIDNFEVV